MFAKEVYVRRRETLLQKMRESGQSGLILFIGNAEAPAQYRDNCYKFRQDSCWLYYFPRSYDRRQYRYRRRKHSNKGYPVGVLLPDSISSRA